MANKHITRFLTVGLLFLVATLGLSVAAVYGISEWKLRRHYEAPLVPLTAKTPDAVEGKRLSHLVGCLTGCHGRSGEGNNTYLGDWATYTAPTLAEVIPLYGDEELVRLIRYGVKRDGRSAIGMTSYAFWSLSDQDLANIIAYWRQQSAAPGIPRQWNVSWRGRLAITSGDWGPSAALVDRSRPSWGALPRTTAFERGRYLASFGCSDCHGVDYGGYAPEKAPSLVILAMYSREQFRHLMRTGEPPGGRDIGIMGLIAREAFVHFKDEEVDDLYQFLRTHHGLPADAQQQVPADAAASRQRG